MNSRTDQTAQAFGHDPDIKLLISLMTGRTQLPARWMTPGCAFPHPPAFVPVVYDTSGTMYGVWRHIAIARPPCFVGISAGESQVKEVARTVEQFWAFLALLAGTTAEGRTQEIEVFLSGTEISAESITKLSQRVGDDRDLFGGHPVFEHDCPSGLRIDGQPDDKFPTSERAETWGLACRYELEGVDLRAPPWLREPGTAVFKEQLSAHSWEGAWLSLNSPGWGIMEARAAVAQLTSHFGDERMAAIVSWSKQMSAFLTGY